MSEPRRMAVITPGPPFDAATWSAATYFLLRAIARQDRLAGAIDGSPPRPLDALLRAAAFSPDRERWRQRYRLGPALRQTSRWTAWGRGRKLLARTPVTLQIGAWSHFDGLPGVPDRLEASYHDGNLAKYLCRPDRPLDARSKLVRRAWAAERATYDRLDLIMVMSDWLRDSFIEDFEQDPGKVVTVGAGANFEGPPPEVPDRRELPPRFLFVGKDFARKGGEDLLDAFEAVRERHPGAELWVAGPTALPRTPPGVRALGFIRRSDPDGVERMQSLYRTATAFVLPSRYEPFGFAFLEAMRFGLPCVGTRTCAMPEIIEEGVTGLIADVADPSSLAEAMSDLAADPAYAAAMGIAGQRRFVERFSWDAVAANMATAVDRLPSEVSPG